MPPNTINDKQLGKICTGQQVHIELQRRKPAMDNTALWRARFIATQFMPARWLWMKVAERGPRGAIYFEFRLRFCDWLDEQMPLVVPLNLSPASVWLEKSKRFLHRNNSVNIDSNIDQSWLIMVHMCADVPFSAFSLQHVYTSYICDIWVPDKSMNRIAFI